MIYITQLVFIKAGQEAIFHEFEDVAIPLMEEHKGKLLYRVRPSQACFISPQGKLPYEIHFVSFDSEEYLNNFLKDERRTNLKHLKDQSIETTITVLGKSL